MALTYPAVSVMFKLLLLINGILFTSVSFAENNMADLSTVIKNDEWAVAEGVHNDLPLMIRFRNKLVPNVNVSALPRLIQIYWNYSEHESGMPSEAESQSMEVFENRLVEALESDISGILAAAITTNGYREWVYYTQSTDIFAKKLHNMHQEIDPYPIEIEADSDPEWNYFFNQVRPE